MIEKLEAKERAKRRRRARAKDRWFLYILRCADGKLYTGITNNTRKRLLSHQTGKGSRFTRTRLPVELVYEEACRSRSAALIRECEIKSFPRNRKEMLIAR